MPGQEQDFAPHAELALDGGYEADPELRCERFFHTYIRRRVTPPVIRAARLGVCKVDRT
jgi:hypothetical protein